MANRLKKLRLKNGLTLAELSKDTEIPTSTLSKYENQKRNLIGINLYKLSNFFSVSTSYLSGVEDLEKIEPMVNLDNPSLIPFIADTVLGKQSAISINQALQWLDNDNDLLNNQKEKKNADVHEKEIELLKTLQNSFSTFRDDIQIGYDEISSGSTAIYIHILETYNSAFKSMNQLIKLNPKSRKAIFEILNSMSYKKASDD